MPSFIIKRDGTQVPFNKNCITQAIFRCFNCNSLKPRNEIETYTHQVINILSKTYNCSTIPTVEEVQNYVEIVLCANQEYEAARHYILYREKHSKLRKKRPVPSNIKKLFDDTSKYFQSCSQQFQFFNKYSRFDNKLGRRETWPETITRTVNFLKELGGNKIPEDKYSEIYEYILNMKVMPSMRLLAMAGKAARKNNICIYNCSYLPVNSIDSFVETLIISMCGCGVGYSVESSYVNQLPKIKKQTNELPKCFVIPDTSEGWAKALRKGLKCWFNGKDISFDYSQIRPAGSVLKTKGGQASGPGPLKQLLTFIREKILSRQGDNLTTLDAHDIMCTIGQAAVSGGVRRTSMISLFDFEDIEMRNCKNCDLILSGNMQRWNANNSVVWPDRHLSQLEIMEFMGDMFKGQGGEPGIFNRTSNINYKPKRRKKAQFGTNPCGEIILRPQQFCNLTSVILRKEDTIEDVEKKVEIATLIGTIQSMGTFFPGLRKKWKINCEEERLLGVDLNGQADFGFQRLTPEFFFKIKQTAIKVNKLWSKILEINQSTAITCVKPSGNSGELLNCSSGLHSRWSNYYIRNMRISAHDPLYKVLKDSGVSMDPENGQTENNAITWVIHFPIKSPTKVEKRTVIQQLNHWLKNKMYYTEHNPSVTITYENNEILEVTKWVYENQDKIGGIAFLPKLDAQYNQMPYESTTKEEYFKLSKNFPIIDFSKLYRYENYDTSNASKTPACEGDKCIFNI